MSVAVTRGNGRRAAASPGGAASRSETIPPVAFEHEDLAVRRGQRSGLHVIVAIHSTALGPALGGVRLWRYAGTIDGARDALRLAQGMTLKAAAAGLDLGGGKGVICAPAGALEPDRRRAALLDFADLVQSLDGRYITAEDVGIGPDDLVAIAERTEHVTGLPRTHGGSGDPSPVTALGVVAAMRACALECFGSPDLAGRRIVVIGLGRVGGRLARRLAEAGAELVVSDIDASKRALAAELGAEWTGPENAIAAECELLAPCALGGAIDKANLPRLRCEAICGSANNQLADESLAEELTGRGIVYAPDFIANAGGLINVYRELRGYSAERARELALGIEPAMTAILSAARERDVTPLVAAREVARERLEGASAHTMAGEPAMRN